MSITIRCVTEYEGGDPGAPLGERVTVKDGDTELCEMWFGNENNEELQTVLIAALRTHYGVDETYGSTADNDYGFW